MMMRSMNKVLENIKNKINSRKILIIAGNYQQFKLFCDETLADYERHNNLEFEGVEFIYYNESDSIRGNRFDDFIKCGNWWDRNDIDWNGVVYPSVKPDYWADMILKGAEKYEN